MTEKSPARRAAEKLFDQMAEVAADKRDEISMREWTDLIAAEYADLDNALEQLAWTLRYLFKSFPELISEALQTAISEPIIAEEGIGDAEAAECAVELAAKYLEQTNSVVHNLEKQCDALRVAITSLQDDYDKKRNEVAAEMNRLRKALRLCDRYCKHLHHEPKHYHRSGEPCPVEEFVDKALEQTNVKP